MLLYEKKIPIQNGGNAMQEEKELTLKDLILKKRETSKKVDTKLIIKTYNYARRTLGDTKRKNRRKIYSACIRCCVFISRNRIR